MSDRHAICLLSFFLALALTGCSRTPAPDYYPKATAVTLKMRLYSPEASSPEQLQLGPRSSQLFLDMLTNQPVRSEISHMPALPKGTFTVADTEYLWHGNGVIRGTGRHERLWHGPYLQRLIIDVMRQEPGNRESLRRILDALERDSTVEATPLQGPGQYPGDENDALHPTRLTVGDTNGWHVTEPPTNAP